MFGYHCPRFSHNSSGVRGKSLVGDRSQSSWASRWWIWDAFRARTLEADSTRFPSSSSKSCSRRNSTSSVCQGSTSTLTASSSCHDANPRPMACCSLHWYSRTPSNSPARRSVSASNGARSSSALSLRFRSTSFRSQAPTEQSPIDSSMRRRWPMTVTPLARRSTSRSNRKSCSNSALPDSGETCSSLLNDSSFR